MLSLHVNSLFVDQFRSLVPSNVRVISCPFPGESDLLGQMFDQVGDSNPSVIVIEAGEDPDVVLQTVRLLKRTWEGARLVLVAWFTDPFCVVARDVFFEVLHKPLLAKAVRRMLDDAAAGNYW